MGRSVNSCVGRIWLDPFIFRRTQTFHFMAHLFNLVLPSCLKKLIFQISVAYVCFFSTKVDVFKLTVYVPNYLNIFFLKYFHWVDWDLQYACLHGCRMVGANLSWCTMERADLSHAQLEGAQLLGVKMLCANLEGANLRGCNFEDPAGVRANMEGRNCLFIFWWGLLKSTNLLSLLNTSINYLFIYLKLTFYIFNSLIKYLFKMWLEIGKYFWNLQTFQ